MSGTEVRDTVLEALRLTLASHLRRTRGTTYPWLDVANELVTQTAAFQRVYDNLADDESRRTYLWMQRYRLAGYLTQSREWADEIAPYIISPRRWREMKDAASTMPERDMEGHIDVDIVENFVLDGYRLPGICEVAPGDTVLDLGAFNGNSTVVLARLASPSGMVYAFEPNPDTEAMLGRNLAKMGISNVTIVPSGVGETEGALRFSQGGAGSRFDPHGNIEVPITTIDKFVEDRQLSRVDFLKFDIEGFELQTLRGAGKTILTHRPKMAISIYHLHWDAHALFSFVYDLCPWYEFYVRHNNMGEGEVVMFCKPIERWTQSTGVSSG